MDHLSNNKKSILESDLFVLCQEKNTGTLFLQTNRKTTAQVVLQHGAITEIAFEDKNGLDAIKDIKEAVYNNIQFIPYFNARLSYKADIDCSKTALSKLGYDEYREEMSEAT